MSNFVNLFLFRKYLRSPKHLTLYEIMYFDNLKMKPNLVGNNQGAIQTALGDPHHYLKVRNVHILDVNLDNGLFYDFCYIL